MLNLIPRSIKLTINGKDWSPWLFEFSIGWDEMSLERGVCKVSGTITLKLGKTDRFPANPDTRVNRSEWDRGTPVQITVDGNFLPCAGNALYILKLPPRPWGIEKRMTIEVGDILTLRSFAEPNPDEELTGVEIEAPLSRKQVILNILDKAGIDSSKINLSSYTDTIVYPYQKQSGSFIDFAGQISAADSNILFSNNVDIVNKRWLSTDELNQTPSPPPPIYDYVELMPTSEYTPIGFEELYARSIVYAVENLGKNFTEVTEVKLPLGVIFPDDHPGDTRLRTAERTAITYKTRGSEDRIQTTIERPLGVIFPDYFRRRGDDRLRTAEESLVIKKWDTNGRLLETRTEKRSPLGVIFPNDLPGDERLRTTELAVTKYIYSTDGIVVSINSDTKVPLGVLFSIYRRDTRLSTKIKETNSWKQLPNGLYTKSTTILEPLGVLQPETSPFATGLSTSKSETIVSDEPPPAVEYRPPRYKLTEKPIEIKVQLPTPPNANLPRRADRFVPFITSENQLITWATNYISLQHYRNNGWFVTLEYTPLFPGDVVKVRDAEVIFDLIADAVTYQLTPDRLVVSFTGLTVRETPTSSSVITPIIPSPPIVEILNQPIEITIGISQSWIQNGDETLIVVTLTMAKPATRDEVVGITFLGLVQYVDGTIPSTVTISKGQTTASFSFRIAPITVPSSPILLYFSIGEISSRLKKGNPDTAILEIRNNLTPFVFITVNVATIGEYHQQAIFTFRRQGDLSNPLIINYAVSGTAPSSAYTPALTGTVTIPAEQQSIDILITSVPNTFVPPLVTLTLTIQPSANYTIKTGSALITIVKTVAPVLYTVDLQILGNATVTLYNPSMTIEGRANVSSLLTSTVDLTIKGGGIYE